MRHLKTVMKLSLILTLFAISPLQAQEAVIVIEAWSPQEIHDMGWTSHPSTGLSVVGVEEIVYLFARGASGEEVTAVTWTMTSRPTGSNTALDSTDTQRTTFHPDVEGQYDIQAEVTTASGTATSSVTITAAKYVGVGTMVPGVAANAGEGQCQPCHSGNETTWKETGHATMFTEAIDGLKSSHYREECIECHTVGFFENAANGGFWDVQQQTGWTFPAVLQPGNWDDIVTNFPDLAQKSNIQCESCHGPGSLHKGDKSKTAVSLEEGVCGRCHEEEPYHRRNIMWKRSGHSVGVGFAAGRSGCADCHSGYGFIAKIDPISDLDHKTGFQQISCAVCHDPHSGRQGEHQIRDQDDVILGDGTVITKGGKGKLCMNCHIGRRDAITYAQQVQRHFGPHHSNQADMLFGTNVITWGVYVPSSTHRDALEDACVSCHMFATPAAEEPGRDFIGDHTFAMTYDGGTPENPADDIDHVVACQTCHGESLTSFDDIMAREDHDEDGTIESAKAELAGMMDRVGLLLPPIGNTFVEEDPTDDFTRLQLNALFNYNYVVDDGSHGMHNFQFAINLMKLTESALMHGVLTGGDILSVTDVPNDQGKQVRVAWTRFGGDGVSDNPVQTYGIWRRVDDAPNGAAKRAPAHDSWNFSVDQIKELNPGALVQIDEELWDFAGSVPAAGLDQYSAIAPTLFDSTTAGKVYSVFVVSGHTQVPVLTVTTEPDSGYSIDNLAPFAPTNVVGTSTAVGLSLVWDDPVDEDFKNFAIYRATAAGFDPGSVDPLSSVTESAYLDQDVNTGITYYYRISTRDFSGNESAFSPEIALTVTSVGDHTTVIPEDYFLDQNYPNPFNPSTTIRF
ncbi:hypothetical protein MJD09_24800, partial [bacterium]|nr:hypothetical protein [bacterium]